MKVLSMGACRKQYLEPQHIGIHIVLVDIFFTCKLFGNVVPITFQNAAKILGLIVSAALFALMRNLISMPYFAKIKK